MPCFCTLIKHRCLGYCIRQIDFILPWVCTLITHRGRQNVVRTKKYATIRRRVAWLIFSKLTFIPEGNIDLKTVIDYSPLPDFYGRHISTNICFLFTPQQSPSFFILVEVTLKGLILSNFYRAVFLSRKNLPVYVPLLAKTVCKTLLTSHSVWTLDSDHVRLSRALVTPLDDVNRASIL